jgi:hypothetical protein
LAVGGPLAGFFAFLLSGFSSTSGDRDLSKKQAQNKKGFRMKKDYTIDLEGGYYRDYYGGRELDCDGESASSNVIPAPSSLSPVTGMANPMATSRKKTIPARPRWYAAVTKRLAVFRR